MTPDPARDPSRHAEAPDPHAGGPFYFRPHSFRHSFATAIVNAPNEGTAIRLVSHIEPAGAYTRGFFNPRRFRQPERR